ncbi:hypothetical protein TRAPUB_10668 [Trametes pubescens]|uniref:Uncharacterized protein n=1 Tax=Trametes pubescens TaxID=154538 RepID=A0A1M2VZ40_TRAPU|nr:hypothetical protein TRAPUB_10668 [Trametes pubescens]
MDRASSSDSSGDSPPHMTGADDDLAMESAGPDSFIHTGAGFGNFKDRDVFQASSTKRYGRPGQFGGGDGAREPKARRKDPRGGQSSSLWDAMGGGPQVRMQKDELVDTSLVEQLRNQFGDPFDDSMLKKSAGTGP